MTSEDELVRKWGNENRDLNSNELVNILTIEIDTNFYGYKSMTAGGI